MTPLAFNLGPTELIILLIVFLVVAAVVVAIVATALSVAKPRQADGRPQGPADPVETAPGPADQLSSLITLYQQGVLSAEEFDRAKQRILN